MKTMPITEFKAHALRVLDQVAQRRETILVTRHGKPIAEITPHTTSKATAGKLSGALVFEKDIVSPLGSKMWNAAK